MTDKLLNLARVRTAPVKRKEPRKSFTPHEREALAHGQDVSHLSHGFEGDAEFNEGDAEAHIHNFYKVSR